MRKKEWRCIGEQRRKCVEREVEAFCEEVAKRRGFEHETKWIGESVVLVKFVNQGLLGSRNIRKQKQKRVKREIEVFRRGDGRRRVYKYYYPIGVSKNILRVWFIKQELLDWMKCLYGNTRRGVIKLRDGFVKSVRVTKRIVVKSGKGVKIVVRTSKKAIKKMNSLRKKTLEKRN